MLQRFRETAILVLIGLLPFHALLVTAATKLIMGPGHAPMTALALWKEGFLATLILVGIIELLMKARTGELGFAAAKSWDIVDTLIGALLVLSIAVTAMTHGDWQLYLFGFKYDFVPLIVFFVLRRVPWSDWLKRNVLSVLLIASGIVAAYGIVSFFLPQTFFTWLGYSDLHSLYQPEGPLAAFQQISESSIRRIQSTMSGPNQLGLWLLVPLSVWITSVSRRKVAGCWLLVAGLILGLALLLTFSRSAWIAAAVIIVTATVICFPRVRAKRLLLGLAGLGIALVVVLAVLTPGVLSRVTSTRGHIEKPLQAMRIMAAHPLGLGLGSAGPASNRISDSCVFLEEGADASWAGSHENLCVFVGDGQIQPIGRNCNCPLITENWYLQIGVELGVLGFLLFVALTLLLLRRLTYPLPPTPYLLSIALAFLGISIAALFLHAWEDSAVAYTVWTLIAVVDAGRHACSQGDS